MTVTVTNIVAGPFAATGAEQTVSFDYKVFSPSEVEVVTGVGSSQVTVDPGLYTVNRNMALDGQVLEGGTIVLSAGAVAVGVSMRVIAKPKLTQEQVWSDTSSRLKNLNEGLDRAALRAQRAAYDGALEGAGAELISQAEEAGAAAGAAAVNNLAVRLDGSNITEDVGETLFDAIGAPAYIREFSNSRIANTSDYAGYDYSGNNSNVGPLQEAINETSAAGASLRTQGGVSTLDAPIYLRPGTKIETGGAVADGYGNKTDEFRRGVFNAAHNGHAFIVDNGRSAPGGRVSGITVLRPQPAVPTSGSWTPNEACLADFKVDLGNDWQFDDIWHPHSTRGYDLSGDRIRLRDIRINAFMSIATLEHSYDKDLFENIHQWPWWNQDTKVLDYCKANLKSYTFGRCDHPTLRSCFSIVNRTFMTIKQSVTRTIVASSFTASIAGNVMTVSAVSSGSITVGRVITGTGVTAGQRVTALGPNTFGGVGTYYVSSGQTLSSRTMAGEAESYPGGSVARLIAWDLDADITRTSLHMEAGVTGGFSAQIYGFVAQGDNKADPQILLEGNQAVLEIDGFNCFENGGGVFEAPGINNRLKVRYDVDYNRLNMGAEAVQNLGPGSRFDRLQGSIARDTGGFGTGEWDGSGTFTGMHKGVPHVMAVAAQDARPITYTSQALEWIDIDGWATLWFKITVTDDGSGSPTGGLLTNVRTAPQDDLAEGAVSFGGTGYGLSARAPAGSLGLSIQDYNNAWPAPAVPGTPSIIVGTLRYKTALAQ